MKKYLLVALLLLLSVLSLGCKNSERNKLMSEITTTELSEQVSMSEKDKRKQDSSTEIITTEENNPREDITIALDPGHQAPSVDMSEKEPNAPESSVMKAKATGGTTGKFTGVGEYELNLTIAKKVRDKLSSLGYNVIMTRDNNETAISNKERAILANEAHANVSVRIHANGSDDATTNGALVIIGSQSNPHVGWLYDDSYRLGEEILNSYCSRTGMKNLGLQENDTMTGINWSEIPVIILEMGFMSNETDDRNMQDDAFQEEMVEGIVQGIESYFLVDSSETNNSLLDEDDELYKIIDSKVKEFSQQDSQVSVCVEDLITGEVTDVNNESMIAASLIKLYIAGCIYELQETDPENAPQDVDDLINKMLSQSDNDATNALIIKLGNGDAATGMSKVNTYCTEHGLTDSSMGRLMLDFSSGKENYTSVKDTTAFLRSVYKGNIDGSEKIISYLKNQERRSKIPAGIPDGIIVANKTGELDNVENDVAIVFADDHPYVISVMMGNLTDTAYAREWMVGLSTEVYCCHMK